MKAIGKLTDGRLILEVVPQELVDLEEAARTILLTVGTVRAGIAETIAGESVPAEAQRRRGRPVTVREGEAGVTAEAPRRKIGRPRKGTSVKRKFNKAADLAVQHCEVCGQDYQPRRCDQKAHGKGCPGKRKAQKVEKTATTKDAKGSQGGERVAPVAETSVVWRDAAKLRALREARELEKDRTEGIGE